MSQIVANMIRTPDGTILRSYHRHDYVTHIDTKDGKEYMVDGGLAYLRRNVGNHTELSVYSTDPHSMIRNVFRWGTYGIEGDKPLRWVKLKDMDEDHIQAIIDKCLHVPKWRIDIFKNELHHRSK